MPDRSLRAPRRLLVVEDDPDFAESLVDLLEPLGFMVRVTANAADAIDTLSGYGAELALIDVKLGTDDGTKLVPLLKERRPSLVCILMTAYASLESAVEALKNGADDYLFKPLEPAELGRRVQSALESADAFARAQREQRLVLLGHLCSGVAHDVNNYLQAILLDVDDAQTALTGPAPEVSVVAERLATISVAVEASADICHRMLKFAKGHPSGGRCDATLVVRESERLLRRLVRPEVAVQFSVDEGAMWIGCGAIELQQVLMNLVRNAGQAVLERGTIEVALEHDRRPGQDGAHLAITDDGSGMTEDLLSRIFEPYFSTKARHEGTGLGLSTVHGIVRGAGGEIVVFSEPGQGARFDVYFPTVDAVEPTTIPAAVPDEVLGTERRVLIVDDSSSLLGIMERVFRRHGFGVLGASSAENALEQFQVVHSSLTGIICDVSLPGMSGLELATEESVGDAPISPLR